MDDKTQLLTEIEAELGAADYRANAHRWRNAAEVDLVALRHALVDLRKRKLDRTKGRVEKPGAWMMGAFKQHSTARADKKKGPWQ